MRKKTVAIARGAARLIHKILEVRLPMDTIHGLRRR
jgi:hypothetical protein